MADPSTTNTAVIPYDRISDVDVVMTVIRPRPVVGLGNLLILNLLGSSSASTSTTQPASGGSQGSQPTQPAGKETNTAKSDTLTDKEKIAGIISRKTDTKTGAVYGEYGNIDALALDYGEETDVYTKANTYFAQENRSDRVAVLDIPAGKEYEALKAFWYFNWTFAALAKSVDDQDEMVKLSNIFEANKDHFLVLQSNNIDMFDSLQSQNYTIGIKHDTAEAMDVALVGRLATETVGSVNWHGKSLKGITPELMTSNERDAIDKVNAIAYTEVFGQGETTSGKVLSGEYIDVLHGVIWVRNEMQSALQKLLQNNEKIPYEQRGINMILATASSVLARAWDQGIILTTSTGKGDYTITATPREDQSAKDLSDRHYGGLSFTYHASGAVDTITVYGSVQSDTLQRA